MLKALLLSLFSLLALAGEAASAANAGSLDTTFIPQLEATAVVSQVIPAADGRSYVSGRALATIDGESRSLVRLNADGSLDTSCRANLGWHRQPLVAVALDREHRMLVSFEAQRANPTGAHLPPISFYVFLRLTPTGTRDTAFSDNVQGVRPYPPERVMAIGVDEAGRPLLSGKLYWMGDQKWQVLGRMHETGIRDQTFTGPESHFESNVWNSHRVSADGRGGVVRWAGTLARFAADGTHLGSTPDAGYFDGFVDYDGRTVAASKLGVQRFLSDGTADSSFSFSPAQQIKAVAAGPDRTTVVVETARIERLNAHGEIDSAFQPPAFDGALSGAALTAFGDCYVFGNFTKAGTESRMRLARLHGGFATVFTLDSPAIALEANSVQRLTARRVGDLSEAAQVTITTAPATATAGFDFTPVETVLNLAPGEETAEIDVPTFDDDEYEGGETYSVQLHSPSTGVLGADARRGAGILDPSPGEVSLPKHYRVLSERDNMISVPITRSGGTESRMVVRLRWGSDNPSNYSPLEWEVTIPAGASLALVHVPLRDLSGVSQRRLRLEIVDVSPLTRSP